jgi:hypothetical protein
VHYPETAMEVLKSKALSEEAAAKILSKFVKAKEQEENTDLMVTAQKLKAPCLSNRRGADVLLLVV